MTRKHNISLNPAAGYWQPHTQIQMTPPPAARLLRFVGDRIRFEIHTANAQTSGMRAFLRTTLGQEATLRRRAMSPMTGERVIAGADWRNIPMQTEDGRTWWVECTLTEPGFFWAKSYFVEPDGQTHWPEGENAGISVHPAALRSGNTIYCAFPRLFGETRFHSRARDGVLEAQFKAFDAHNHTLIPPSGTLRDLTRQLPHIVGKLGCRIIHLLPVGPTPTVYARMGRHGSPYASLDLTDIDPALVEFDKRTTGIDQFCELTREAHHLGARVMLDIVINHTGWSSRLHENHPEWFVRHPNGEFKSPGAWGVVWGDLVELEQSHTELWRIIADSLLTWCRRGVDAFRCDAGYMIPSRTWHAITARVREEFPETIFLLEGLGGAWSATETLLTQGRMQWAYSELFQNYDGPAIASYNDHSIAQNERVGLLVHYSETHDNLRLADKGKLWSLHRNRLCALLSHSGAFGFTCGVEWLATERIKVHESHGLNWDAADNIVEELATLNQLLQSHPCFHEHTQCRRISAPSAPVYQLERRREDIAPYPLCLYVLANTDMQNEQQVPLRPEVIEALGPDPVDLLGQALPFSRLDAQGTRVLTLPPGAVYCLSEKPYVYAETGRQYRNRRKRHGLVIQALATRFYPEDIGPCDWRELAALIERNPRSLLGAVMRVSRDDLRRDPVAALEAAMRETLWDPVSVWQEHDAHRITPVPAEHWLLVQHRAPFRILFQGKGREIHLASTHTHDSHIAVLPPYSFQGDVTMEIDSLHLSTAQSGQQVAEGLVRGQLRFLNPTAEIAMTDKRSGLVLLTNGRGGMARLHANFGAIESKYDCALGINAHPEWPVDRHILVKRVRAWVVTDGFSQALDAVNLDRIVPGQPATFEFTTGACGGYTVPISLRVTMVPGRNTTAMRFSRQDIQHPSGRPFPVGSHMDLIVRVDLENRNFHQDTFYTPDLDEAFRSRIVPRGDGSGYAFYFGHDEPLHVYVADGQYNAAPEWVSRIPHPIDAARGQHGSGDAFSPGWFKVDLRRQAECTLVMNAVPRADAALPPLTPEMIEAAFAPRTYGHTPAPNDPFDEMLARASHDFIVNRSEGKTIIAGYPWFLDWGRDTLISARGLVAMGYDAVIEEILTVFGKFVENGTLPNCIHGADVSNRDTSDAPLWYNIVLEEWAARKDDPGFLARDGRYFVDVIANIAAGYIRGTPNGIFMDPESALVYSPSHFTWMDTNFPAGTPRTGYPVEIQALWIRLLEHLHRLDVPALPNTPSWRDLADTARHSLVTLFWDVRHNALADCIRAEQREPAKQGIRDTALRSNAVFAVALDVIQGDMARGTVLAALHHLVVPGAIRSLAPLSVDVPLPIHGADGRLLNNPHFPYHGHYAGDEDTARKPAYHNGTAWTWPFPMFCEALAKAWDCQDAVLQSARSYLLSMDALLTEGCLGHLPEIADGNAPHTQRGCDAQAWGSTEALRVWRWLNRQ